MTVYPIRPPESLDVYRTGELPEVEEVRMVAMSARQAASLEILGQRLCEIGAPDNGAMCLAIAAMWKVAQ